MHGIMQAEMERRAALVSQTTVFSDDVQAVAMHEYAEEVRDVTPPAQRFGFSEYLVRNATLTINGAGVGSVLLGRVEPGEFWLVQRVSAFGANPAAPPTGRYDLHAGMTVEQLPSGQGYIGSILNITQRPSVEFGSIPAFVDGGQELFLVCNGGVANSQLTVTMQALVIGK